MAEPGWQYEEDDEKPVTRPDLKALEEGDRASNAKASKPDVKEGSTNKGKDGKALKTAEQRWGKAGVVKGGKADKDDQVGTGFNPEDSLRMQRLKQVFDVVGRNKKKALVGGGVAGGVVAIFIALFLALIPLKIENIIQNLRNHFFAGSNSALENETNNLFERYLSREVGPVLRTCGSTINKDCKVIVTGKGPVSDLYRTWANAHIETDLADRFGIEISYVRDSSGGKYYIKTPGSGEQQIGEDGQINDTEFLGDEVSIPELRSTLNDALSEETLWKQVYLRFKWGRFMEEKLSVPRCLVFCDAVDALNGFQNQLQNTAKYFISKRVLLPLSESQGLAAMCLFDQNCDPGQFTDNTPADADGDNITELNGAPESQFESDLTSSISNLIGDDAGQISADDFANLAKDLDEEGLSQAIVSNIVNKLVTAITGNAASGASAGSAAADAVPIVGWLEIAAQAVHTAHSAAEKLKKLEYIVEAASAARLFMTFATQASEMKSGHESAAEVGSFVNTLDQGSGSNVVGGSATAESTPLYSKLIDGNSNAVGSDFQKYKCENGSPVPDDGSLVCPSEHFGNGNPIFNNLNSFLNSGNCNIPIPGTSVKISALDLNGLLPPCDLVAFSQIWDDTLGRIVGIFGSAIGAIFRTLGSVYNDIPCGGILGDIGGLLAPGHQIYCAAKDAVHDAAPYILSFVVDHFLPTPFATNMSGGRTFDMLAAGADVSGNNYAHNGLGGQVLSSQAVAQIDTQQEDEAQQQFRQEPLTARLFDSSSPYSLVSKIAIAMPGGGLATTAEGLIDQVLSNPFQTIFHGIASIVSPPKASAATLSTDPFGITQYGYPETGQGSVPADPDTYWDQHCSDGPNGAQTQAWNNAAESDINQDTGDPQNTSTDPCLLIEAAVGSAGAIWNQNLLTPDDLADSSGSQANTGPSNSIVYQIGDSLSNGMQAAGYENDLSNNGWIVNNLDASPNLDVAGAIPKLQTDSAQITAAGTVIIELGSSDINDTQTVFEQQIQNMISAVRAINATTQIYWINTYSSINPNYVAINQALSAEEAALNFKIIDWANDVTSNPGMYTFDTALGIYPQGTGYTSMAQFVANGLGTAPVQTAQAVNSSGNYVAQALLGSKSSHQSFFNRTIRSLANIAKTVLAGFTKDAKLWSGKLW